MVVIAALAACETGKEQERTARPRRCTVQAPHWAIPQPNFVPFKLRTSLMTHKRGVSAGTSTVVVFPFTFRVKGISVNSQQRKGDRPGREGVLDGTGP